MANYVTIAANFEATGAALTACEPEAGLIHRPDLRLERLSEEVTPATTTR